MKLWPTTIENKYFMKMLWHLLGKCVKVTVLLVCSICTIHRFFLFFIFSQSSICALFSTIFLHGSYSVFHYSSTVPFWLATLSFLFFWIVVTVPSYIVTTIVFFFFSLLFVLFFPFIYISMYIQCFCVVNLQCHFVESFCFFFF